jgi:histone H1/5
MARRNPEGIIDDIFLPVGKKAVHEVRSGVREILRQSAKAAEKNKKAEKYVASKQARHKQEFGGIKSRMERNMDRKATPAGKKSAGLNTQATAKVQLSKVTGDKSPRHLISAKSYQKNLGKLTSDIKKRFPDEASFQRALKEEARDVKKAKNVSQAQKKAPAKKAPVKKAPAKKAPAKKAVAPKTPKGK